MMPHFACLREFDSERLPQLGPILLFFSFKFIDKNNFVKVEMIKGIYDYSKKGKDFLKGVVIGSSKHFVNV